MELLTLHRLEPASGLAQKQDLRRVVDVLDEVVGAPLVVERVVELELALAAGFVDEGYVLWVCFVFSQASVSAGGRGGSAATS